MEEDRGVAGRSDPQIHANPAGVVYEVALFHQTLGAVAVGDTSDKFTWFPGYDWQIAVCATCHQHLGWRFGLAPKGTGHPGEFWALISGRLELRIDSEPTR